MAKMLAREQKRYSFTFQDQKLGNLCISINIYIILCSIITHYNYNYNNYYFSSTL